MVQTVIDWVCWHPLQSVAGLAAMGIIVGLLAIPGLHELTQHGHPRT
jgi:hypothetical protein